MPAKRPCAETAVWELWVAVAQVPPTGAGTAPDSLQQGSLQSPALLAGFVRSRSSNRPRPYTLRTSVQRQQHCTRPATLGFQQVDLQLSSLRAQTQAHCRG